MSSVTPLADGHFHGEGLGACCLWHVATDEAADVAAHSGHSQIMLIAAAIVMGFGVIGVVVTWLERRDLLGPVGSTVELGRMVPALVAGLSAGAAAIHFSMTSIHFAEFWGFGVFFAVVAWAQAVWAALYLLRTTHGVAALGLGGNLAVVLVWVLTRTIGLPLGLHNGEAEAVGTVDAMATIFELGLVIMLALVLLPRASRALERWRLPTAMAWIYGATSLFVVAVLTTAALSGTAGAHL